MKWGNTEFNELTDFRDRIAELEQSGAIEENLIESVKELTARFLALVIPATPVGVYPASAGKVGGNLRRRWTAEMSVDEFVYSVAVINNGNSYEIEVVNDADYAEYVEYGHRTPGGKGWVVGRFMMTKSEIIMNQQAPQLIQKRFEDLLKGVVNG